MVYQGCNAVVTLVTKGGGQTMTKHLQARMNLGKEMVDEGRFKVIYAKAKDGFSKPYDPVKHKSFARLILGEWVNMVNRWAWHIENMSNEEKDMKNELSE